MKHKITERQLMALLAVYHSQSASAEADGVFGAAHSKSGQVVWRARTNMGGATRRMVETLERRGYLSEDDHGSKLEVRMPNKKLDELRDYALKHAESILIGKPGAELMPVWLIEAKNSERIVVVTPFDSIGSKAAAIRAVKAFMQQHEAVRFSFVTEAWVARVDKDEWEGGDKRQPSERPDRVEAVMIITADLGGERTSTYETVRDDKGVVKELKFHLEPDGQNQGQFANMLEAGLNG